MAKYIDKDKAHMYCADNMLADEITKEQADLIDDFLEGCSTVDIVHCKDCQYWPKSPYDYCPKIKAKGFDCDDYCSYGELKEQEHE